MKKFILFVLVICSFASFAPDLSAAPVFDGPGLEDGGDIAKRDLDSSVAKTDDMKSLIVGWTNFLLSVAAVLTVAGLVWAGFLYITSFVDEGQAEKAKKVITYVIVGVIVILASYAIVYTIMSASF